MIWTKDDIAAANRIQRLNIINSITGIKPANLIGTRSALGQSNLAIFSSVVHLGSNPPLLGMITRPEGEVRRHTYENLKETGFYTINQVPSHMTEQAHYTAAKFPEDASEFEGCGFEEVYLKDFQAPFVKESPLKIGLQYEQSIPIEANGTILVIGSVQLLEVADEAISTEGYIDLEVLGTAGISGLNSYYKLQKVGEYPYARVSEVPALSK